MSGSWLTFDCFGTLIDWRHGVSTTAELLFPGRGGDVLEGYMRREAELEAAPPFPRYRAVLAEGLRRAAQDLSLPLGADDADALAVTLPFWPVFADVGEALAACRAAGWRLALLTNCDRDLIGLTRRRLPDLFDAAITAEDVRAYKPDPAHFRRFQEVFGPERWVHVAQGYFHDIRPCHALGIPRIWINRLGQPDDPGLADAVLTGLSGLAEAVERLAGPASATA
ncbi:MAG TPA: HAD family hydrolase [Candidatus Binatia bacterium]|nr:HAD family hydrolase [Candidatus Binatia bacterium]